MTSDFPLGIFQGVGIELEYMIVDRDTLDVKPIADKILAAAAGEPVSELALNGVAWCNELVLHVLEMKTNGPASNLHGLSEQFGRSVRQANGMLEKFDAVLLPTAMHPWMDPLTETRLWPHEQNEVYRSYDRIFGCRGHGWSNLQCTHINLPFQNDDEFRRLHTAIRTILPLIPALAASSPIVEGRLTGLRDNRLEFYRNNQKQVPSIAGGVIPEVVHSMQEYHDRILQTIYQDIAPYDPDGILQYEWLNSRGAIARFDRGAIEIRVIDIQECPRADMAVAALIVGTVKALAEERWISMDCLEKLEHRHLVDVMNNCLTSGEVAIIDRHELFQAFGLSDERNINAGEAWKYLASELLNPDELHDEGWGEVLETIFTEGTLSSRILKALEQSPKPTLRQIYGELKDCLVEGRLFHAKLTIGMSH